MSAGVLEVIVGVTSQLNIIVGVITKRDFLDYHLTDVGSFALF
jgi:hypothetical protein